MPNKILVPVGTWFLFSSLLRPRATRLERTNLTYASLARITRHGGFPIVLIIRLSAIPSHFSTAVFSTCDVKFWYFFVATFLSLPKQIVLVWLGVLLVEEREGEGGAVQTGMFVGLGVATVVLAGWIGWRMRGVRGALLEEQEGRRKGRQAEREGREKEKEKDREEVVDTEEDLTRLSPVALD